VGYFATKPSRSAAPNVKSVAVMIVGKLFEDCGTQAEFLPTSQRKRLKRGNPQGAMVGSRFCATFVDAKVARRVGAEAHVTCVPNNVTGKNSPEQPSQKTATTKHSMSLQPY
jgi:hypothetical protein